MNISSFDDLLRAARLQPEPQRLLFVFAGAGLPDDCTPEQRARFVAGCGGELTPLFAVDKAPEALESFTVLARESQQFGGEWSIVFAASLAGRGDRAPTDEDAGRSLDLMVERIKRGEIGAFIPFDRAGQPVRFS